MKTIPAYNELPIMVTVQSGDFIMGDDKFIYPAEKPAHKVTILKSFAMSKYQVTFIEYDLYCDSTGVKKPNDGGWGRDRRPVINVSWYEAIGYCEWLSIQTGHQYRLPTEAEWEYACRAGSTTNWCFGNNKNKLKHYAWYNENSGYKTHNVGEKRPNKFGLYDMHGNVSEWCADGVYDNYKGAPIDGSAWVNPYEHYSIIRGGSSFDTPIYCSSVLRLNCDRDIRDNDIGFRVVCELSENKQCKNT
jgi:formylglycine-generating enzyme required for sulfatase activity